MRKHNCPICHTQAQPLSFYHRTAANPNGDQKKKKREKTIRAKLTPIGRANTTPQPCTLMTLQMKEQNNASSDLAFAFNVRRPAAKGATLNMTRQCPSADNNRLGTVRAQTILHQINSQVKKGSISKSQQTKRAKYICVLYAQCTRTRTSKGEPSSSLDLAFLAESLSPVCCFKCTVECDNTNQPISLCSLTHSQQDTIKGGLRRRKARIDMCRLLEESCTNEAAKPKRVQSTTTRHYAYIHAIE